MKIALFIEGDRHQIVLTPENDTEKALLKKLQGGVAEVLWGSFYECKGGWTREGADTDSAIIVLETPQ